MSTYRLQTAQQGVVGPIRAAAIRDLAAAGVAHADALVSRDGGPFLPFRAFPELLAAAGDGLAKGPEPSFSGDLGQRTFLRLLDRISAGRLTGQLLTRDGIRRVDVYFDLGRLAFVMSATTHDRLGDLLVREKRATREQIEAGLRVVKKDNRGLGMTLVQNGVLTKEDLRAVVREQALARLVDVCAWTNGHYAFFEGATLKADHVDIGDIMPRVFVRAARALSSATLHLRLASVAEEIVATGNRARPPAWLVHLDEEERLAFAQIDGKATVRELLAAAPPDSSRGRALLTVVYLAWESSLTSRVADPAADR